MKPKPKKPNCLDCVHRRAVPGDAHSRCGHPAIQKDPLAEMLSIFAGVGRGAPVVSPQAIEFGIQANPTGVARGWFNWPYNFDPVWLEACSKFKKE